MKCRLLNVLHVPDVGYQLLSVPTLDKSGLKTSFHSQSCWIEKDNQLVGTGTMTGNLYRLDVTANQPHSALVTASLHHWHQRLAHIHPTIIIEMAKNKTVRGINIDGSSQEDIQCNGCIMGKAHRSPIPKKSETQTSQLLELVHSDVNGPFESQSHGGSRYFVTFINDYSRCTTIYTMRKKSETFTCFKKFLAYAEKHTGSKLKAVNVVKRTGKSKEEIKSIRTDNGGEYISREFKSYLEDRGIHHQLTIAYTPQQNGVAERMNRTLIDLVRSMLHHASMPKSFWAEALSTAVYNRNRTLSRSLRGNTTPSYQWFGYTPDLSHTRIFGCRWWYVIPKTKVKKLDARSREAIMVGYSLNSKGYKLWDAESKSFVISRDVKFDEKLDRSNSVAISSSDEKSIDVAIQEGECKEEVHDDINSQSTPSPKVEVEEEEEEEREFHDANKSPQPELRRSSRIRKQTGAWWKTTSLLAYALAAQVVPTSYKDATRPDNIDFWQEGIDREHASLLKCKTWTLVDRKPGINVLPSKYVLRVKENKPRVRLVALVCRQISGIDYNETFAPVVSMTTIRTILSLVAHLDLELQQMDLVTAFLNGDLTEDIYMAIPEGLKSEAPTNKVCKLLKSLCGLKQAPRQWYAKMHNFLLGIGFISSQNDPCLCTRHLGTGIILIALTSMIYLLQEIACQKFNQSRTG